MYGLFWKCMDALKDDHKLDIELLHSAKGQRDRNLVLCLATSPTWGLVYWKFIRGGMTKETFSDILSELSELGPEDSCEPSIMHEQI